MHQSPSKVHFKEEQTMSISEKVKHKDKSSNADIEQSCSTVACKVEQTVDEPVVLHFKAIDLHVVHKSVFLFHHEVVQKDGHHQGKADWVCDHSDEVNNLLDFFVNLRVERHKLLS